MFANFLLGELSITDAAKKALHRMPLDLIARHAINDYGKITVAQHRVNAKSMKSCGQIVSSYSVDPTDQTQGLVLIVTVEGWDRTSIQLASE